MGRTGASMDLRKRQPAAPLGGIPVPDAKGLETMLKGAREKARSDDALLAHSMRAFDLLYSGYRTG